MCENPAWQRHGRRCWQVSTQQWQTEQERQELFLNVFTKVVRSCVYCDAQMNTILTRGGKGQQDERESVAAPSPSVPSKRSIDNVMPVWFISRAQQHEASGKDELWISAFVVGSSLGSTILSASRSSCQSAHFGLTRVRVMPGLQFSCHLRRFRDSHLPALGFVAPTQSIDPKSSLRFENPNQVA